MLHPDLLDCPTLHDSNTDAEVQGFGLPDDPLAEINDRYGADELSDADLEELEQHNPSFRTPFGYIDTLCIHCHAAILIRQGTGPGVCPGCIQKHVA